MNEQLLTWLVVAIGSAIGGLARYVVTIASARALGEAFPWGTLGINIAGSFVIGLFFTLTLANGAIPASANTRLFVMTGFCGGFTTFSAFSLQTLQLLNNRDYGAALFYIAGSVVLCIAAVALGFWLGTAVRLPAPAAQPEAGKHALFTLAPRADTVEACLNAAQSLAPAFSDAKLVALHTRMDPTRVIAASEEVLDARASAEFRAAEARQAAAIKSAVASFNARAPRPAEFFDLNADLAAALYAHAKDADLVILGKTPSGPGAEEREALAIALFELKRPLLLVPADWQSTVGTRVCVAWKDMPQTVRAIEAAAAVLKRAGEVRVLAGFRRDAADIGHPEQILGQLGIEAHLVPFGIGTEAVGQTLLRMAHDVSADLLVMGAYSHSRIAEYVLGGVTRYILSHADLPVLMAH